MSIIVKNKIDGLNQETSSHSLYVIFVWFAITEISSGN